MDNFLKKVLVFDQLRESAQTDAIRLCSLISSFYALGIYKEFNLIINKGPYQGNT